MAENEKSISFEIKEYLGVLRNGKDGWNRELNIVSWNGGPAKFDIREWSEDHRHMSKGITLSMTEARKLCDAMTRHLEKNNERETRNYSDRDYRR